MVLASLQAVTQFAVVIKTSLVDSVTDGDNPAMRNLVLMAYVLLLITTRLPVLVIQVIKDYFAAKELTHVYQNPVVSGNAGLTLMVHFHASAHQVILTRFAKKKESPALVT